MTDEKKSSLSAEKEFKVLIERKILIQENCYLLIDLVEQMAKLFEIYSVKGKVGDNKKTKFFLLTNFQDSLLFTPGHGIPIIEYSVEIKPIDYAMSSIIESWLKNEEITLTFSKMINHELKSQELSENFPLSTKNLMRELDLIKLRTFLMQYHYLVTQSYLSMSLATHHP